MSKQYRAALVIMRAQMFHNGHAKLLEEAIRLADVVVVFLGSANKPRSLKNPFTVSERSWMIHDWYQNECSLECDNLIVEPLNDYDYEDMVWEQSLWDAISNLKYTMSVDSEDIVLLTSGKDSDLEERKSYVGVEPIDVISVPTETFEGGHSELSATKLRKMWLNCHFEDLFKYVPKATENFLLTDYAVSVLGYKMREESYHVLDARRPYLELEYEPLFQTGDCMVLNTHGKVLLVQRKKGTYGEGQWALAGGYVHANETIQEGAVRELLEETGVDVSKLTPLHSQTFDKPDRDPRGRMITTCYLYQLEEDVIVTPSDDVSDYKWVSRRELNGEEIFLDHLGIINTMFREICS